MKCKEVAYTPQNYLLEIVSIYFVIYWIDCKKLCMLLYLYSYISLECILLYLVNAIKTKLKVFLLNLSVSCASCVIS